MQDLLATSHPFSPDLIAPINDELEIEMEHIKLHDMLGEGAFGLVRKGVLQRTGDDSEPAQPVAVKMLKGKFVGQFFILAFMADIYRT